MKRASCCTVWKINYHNIYSHTNVHMYICVYMCMYIHTHPHSLPYTNIHVSVSTGVCLYVPRGTEGKRLTAATSGNGSRSAIYTLLYACVICTMGTRSCYNFLKSCRRKRRRRRGDGKGGRTRPRIDLFVAWKGQTKIGITIKYFWVLNYSFINRTPHIHWIM